jgi:hypothetical protein
VIKTERGEGCDVPLNQRNEGERMDDYLPRYLGLRTNRNSIAKLRKAIELDPTLYEKINEGEISPDDIINAKKAKEESKQKDKPKEKTEEHNPPVNPDPESDNENEELEEHNDNQETDIPESVNEHTDEHDKVIPESTSHRMTEEEVLKAVDKMRKDIERQKSKITPVNQNVIEQEIEELKWKVINELAI